MVRRLDLDGRSRAQQEACEQAQLWRGAATSGSKATAANDPHSDDNLTSQRNTGRSREGYSLDHSRVQFDTGLLMRGMRTLRVLDEARLPPGGLAVSLLRRVHRTSHALTRAIFSRAWLKLTLRCSLCALSPKHSSFRAHVMFRTLLDFPLTSLTLSTLTSSSLLFLSQWPTTSTPQAGFLFARFA